jgi:large subunit ribosomal protein L32
MAVPKRRVSHSRKKLRQSHAALTVPAMSKDKTSKSWHRPHHIDLRTGLYRGKQVLFREDDAGADAGQTDAPA